MFHLWKADLFFQAINVKKKKKTNHLSWWCIQKPKSHLLQKELWLKIQKIRSLERQSILQCPVWIKEKLSCPLVYSLCVRKHCKFEFLFSFFLLPLKGYLRLRKAFVWCSLVMWSDPMHSDTFFFFYRESFAAVRPAERSERVWLSSASLDFHLLFHRLLVEKHLLIWHFILCLFNAKVLNAC